MSNLPAGLMVEAVLKNCNIHCIPYYIVQKGNHGSGIIMVKVNMLDGQVKLMTQERDFMTDQLQWVNVFDPNPTGEEQKADAHIGQSIEFDPDMWVIEIEDRQGRNPFVDDL